MNNTLRVVLCIGGLALIFTGCAGSPSGTAKSPGAVAIQGKPLIFLNPQLADLIYVDSILSSRKTNKLLVAEASFQNPAAQTITVQAQTLYYDAAGHLLYFANETEAFWTNITLPPSQDYPYRSQSLTPEADHFAIRIRAVPNS